MSPTAPATPRAPGTPASVPEGLKRVGVAPSLREYFADLWAHRDFLVTVPLGELRAQNQNSALGNFWHLLNPLLLAGVYYLVFGVILNARADIDYYAAFLIIGIMTFTYVGKVIQAGARTVVSNLKLIQSIRFPRASLPLAATISETIAHGPALLTMFALVLVTSHFSVDPSDPSVQLPPIWPQWGWLLVLPATALMAMFSFGLALFTARATFHFRDVQQVLPYVLRIWMYLSGLFYSVEFVAERVGEDSWMVWVFQANPLWQFFTIFREALIDGSGTLWVWGAAAAWSVVIMIAGFVYFRANEAEYGRA